MPSEAEIKAAAIAIRDVEDQDEPAFEFIAHATAALEAAERVRWQPIETAPKDEEFLVWHRGDIRQVHLHGCPAVTGPAAVVDSVAGRMWIATHWQPLLPRPEHPHPIDDRTNPAPARLEPELK